MNFIATNYKGYKILPESEELSVIDLTLEQLIESNFHLGSKLSKFEKLNFNFIFSKRFDILILNLAYSLYNLRLTIYFLTTLVSRRGKVLFFDNHESTRNFVHFIGSTARQYYINRKWIAGLLTNFKNFYPAVFTGVSRHFRFADKYSGMRFIHRPPNVSCLLNITRGSSAFLENFRLGIPTVALVNSDNNIAGVTFPIFSNNNSIYTFYSFFYILRSAALNGYKDEIYKFYRKSLKRILKIRINRFKKNIFTKDSFFLFIRYYFIKLLFVHKPIFFEFFSFLISKLNDPFLSKIISLFIRDLTYFYDRLLFNSSSYSISDVNNLKFKFNIFNSSLKFDSIFFERILRTFIDMFMSLNFPKYFSLFYSSLLPIFILLFNLFMAKLNRNKFQAGGSSEKFFFKFFRDFSFVFFLLNKRFSEYSYVSFPFQRHFSHEFFPFFLSPIERNLSVVKFPYKFYRFRFRTLLFSQFSTKFLNLYGLRNFGSTILEETSWFKFFRFSKNFKKSVRIFSKRLKFLAFLTRTLYPKKRKALFYFDLKKSKHVILSKKYVLRNRKRLFFKKRFFSGLTIKDLSRREFLNNIFNSFMLKYFDEEYEDTPFPFNNEFLFLQIAFGNIFLSREAERNKILNAQRNSFVTVSRDRKLYLRTSKKTRTSRILLYLHYIILLQKKKNNV